MQKKKIMFGDRCLMAIRQRKITSFLTIINKSSLLKYVVTYREHVSVGRLFFLDCGLVSQAVCKHWLVIILHCQPVFQ